MDVKQIGVDEVGSSTNVEPCASGTYWEILASDLEGSPWDSVTYQI